jgi:hypothetical protein
MKFQRSIDYCFAGCCGIKAIIIKIKSIRIRTIRVCKSIEIFLEGAIEKRASFIEEECCGFAFKGLRVCQDSF